MSQPPTKVSVVPRALMFHCFQNRPRPIFWARQTFDFWHCNFRADGLHSIGSAPRHWPRVSDRCITPEVIRSSTRSTGSLLGRTRGGILATLFARPSCETKGGELPSAVGHQYQIIFGDSARLLLEWSTDTRRKALTWWRR